MVLGQGNPTEGHIRLFTYRALRELVELAGFEIVLVTAHVCVAVSRPIS